MVLQCKLLSDWGLLKRRSAPCGLRGPRTFLFLSVMTWLQCGAIVSIGSDHQQQQPLLVATCHIHWDPDYSDVKLIQTMMLMNELKHIVEEATSLADAGASSDSDDCRSCADVPLILCGDFNSLPDSGGFLVIYFSGKFFTSSVRSSGESFVCCILSVLLLGCETCHLATS